MAKDRRVNVVSRDHRQLVINVLNSHVVPKLVKSRQSKPIEAVQPIMDKQQHDKKWLEELTVFCRPLTLGDFDAAQNFLEKRLTSYQSIALIYKDYFPAAARLLGDMWLNDDCSFAEVTIGLEVLHRLISHNASRLSALYADRPKGGSILLAPLPNETHIFGISLMETVYRAANWQVKTDFSGNNAALIHTVHNHHFDVVAVALGDRKRIDECKLLLTQLRAQSANKNIKIAVGGHVFDHDLNAAAYVQADVQVSNIVESLDEMAKFLPIDAV